jgi:hypothetical protein
MAASPSTAVSRCGNACAIPAAACSSNTGRSEAGAGCSAVLCITVTGCGKACAAPAATGTTGGSEASAAHCPILRITVSCCGEARPAPATWAAVTVSCETDSTIKAAVKDCLPLRKDERNRERSRGLQLGCEPASSSRRGSQT